MLTADAAVPQLADRPYPPPQLEDKFGKKAIQMFSQSAGILDSSVGPISPKRDEPETVRAHHAPAGVQPQRPYGCIARRMHTSASASWLTF